MPPPSKKRKITVTAPEKIDFDPSAREEYLTGFHKRKVARQKFAQEEIAKREKEEKLQFRRELRQQRKVDLEKHVEEVNRLVKQANGDLDLGINVEDSSDDEESEDGGEKTFKGFEDPEPINQEDEYIDEDKYTTVTIESVGISRSGFLRPGDEVEEGKKGDGEEVVEGEKKKEEEVKQDAGVIRRDANGKRIWTKEKPKVDWPKKKKKKFRYEAPAERKANRAKQSLKKKKQKAARESN